MQIWIQRQIRRQYMYKDKDQDKTNDAPTKSKHNFAPVRLKLDWNMQLKTNTNTKTKCTSILWKKQHLEKIQFTENSRAFSLRLAELQMALNVKFTQTMLGYPSMVIFIRFICILCGIFYHQPTNKPILRVGYSIRYKIENKICNASTPAEVTLDNDLHSL